MNQHLDAAWQRTRDAVVRTWRRTWSDRGEGVISSAITVLIMAFLGAGMWVAFNALFDDASDEISNQVSEIGNSDGGAGTTTG